jgi:hypothetical protein
MQQACKLLGSDALGALSEGIDDVLDLRHPRSWSFKMSTVPKTRSLITIASTFQ